MTWLKDSNTHLNKSEQELASKGIYYSFSELAEHDKCVALRALKIMERTAAQRRFNVDPQDHQDFFEVMRGEIDREFKGA